MFFVFFCLSFFFFVFSHPFVSTVDKFRLVCVCVKSVRFFNLMKIFHFADWHFVSLAAIALYLPPLPPTCCSLNAACGAKCAKLSHTERVSCTKKMHERSNGMRRGVLQINTQIYFAFAVVLNAAAATARQQRQKVSGSTAPAQWCKLQWKVNKKFHQV